MYRVLVIDDDEQVRSLCRAVLSEGGFDVTDAADGATGIEAFDACPFDLVLCDIFMPNKDGIETIQELTRTYFDVKVIAMSGGATGLPDYLPSARIFGAAEVLRKPFGAGELLDTVNGALGV
jgi:DNA-binding NtrC family response regulator